MGSCNSQTNEDINNNSKDSIKLTVYQFPERTDKSNIYEVNIRQYTPEGTFKAFKDHLPRLKEMGVDILWLMPIYPIGEKYRKATQTKFSEEIEDSEERQKYLGSYYSIKDYKDVNPNFGTKEEFKELVKKIHDMGMMIILDIAVNHTSWDHDWFKTHPDYYVRIEKGTAPWNPDWMAAHPEFFKELKETGFTYPIDGGETDWWDTAELNFDNDDMRKEMRDNLKYWVEEYDIDGYRCDVTWSTPPDFWEDAIAELESIKPVFMLAEADELKYHNNNTFDMSYNWESHHLMTEISKGEKNAEDLRKCFEKDREEYPQKIYRMVFTSNHDENTWKGNVFKRLPESYKTFAVLTFVAPGFPLIYSGQEAGLDKDLRFFEKDTIEWKEHEMKDLYTKLIALKNENKALWNGEAGSPAYFINTSNKEQIFTFKRIKDDNRILVMMNLSPEKAKFNYLEKDFERHYIDCFSGEEMSVKPHEHYILEPWEYRVLIEK